jgi:4-hydroxy-4-methyl-2-oxoglutarate aldolase
LSTPEQHAELARLGSATVYEAGGRGLYVDADLYQAVPGSRAAGPARTVLCAQDDNLMVHAVMPVVQPGDVIVLSMPQARPVALVGDLLATQAQVAGAAAMLIDASVRDTEELAQMGLPIWSRYVRVKGALKETAGELDVSVTVGGALINPGDVLVLDADGVAIIPQDRVEEVLAASLAREQKEAIKRAKLQSGLNSYELDGLRAVVEAQR